MKDLKVAKELVQKRKVFIEVDENKKGIFVHAKVVGRGNLAEAIISDYHNQIVSLKLNGEEVPRTQEFGSEKDRKLDVEKLNKWIKQLKCDELFELIESLDEEDFEFLKKGVLMNLRLAEEGLKNKWGYGVGIMWNKKVHENLMFDSVMLEAKRYVSAAVDARMGGIFLPAMSSAGSGNNGIVAILPVWVVYSHLKISEETFLKAVALSHIFTSKLKAHMGRVSPVCSCALSAGGGAAGAIAYLISGKKKICLMAVKNHLLSLYGILCDGAKPACSLKLATATSCALNNAYLAIKGLDITKDDGISGKDLDETLKYIEELTSNVYLNMDKSILEIMKKKF
jgi:L-cysteine desulfidase